MRIGKLNNEDLETLILSKFHKTRPEALSSPTVGEDCALLDMGNDFIVMSMDPITAASYEELGYLSVHVNCNDAICAGAEPVGLLVTLLIPPSFTKEGIARIADDLSSAAKDIQVDVLGGHTEVTDAVSRPLTCSAVIARKKKDTVLSGLQQGDAIVMSKYAAVEGSLLLYHSGKFKLSPALSSDCEKMQKMLSVVPEGRIALQHDVHAMHDITEGGVLGAVWEMSYAAKKGIVINTDTVPILPLTQTLCQQAGLDPLRLIGSGSLLMACKDGDALVNALNKQGIPASVIGYCKGDACLNQNDEPIQAPEADDLYKGLYF